MTTIQNAINANVANPLTVSEGGTGAASFTAYAPVIAGTTTTGAFQAAATGISTSGNVLTSNGSSSSPTFKPIAITFTGDTGIPFTDNAVTISADNASNQNGSSVLFLASTPQLLFELTDSNGNTLLGTGAGSATLSSTGTFNTSVGVNSLDTLTSGTNNCAFGYLAGSNYTGAESGNVLISNLGTVGESHVIRIGTQGSSAGEQNKTFIAGITGSTPTSGNTPQVTVTDNAGNVSVISSGTSGYVLTSNGSATPSFQAASGGSGFTSINVQTFSSSGTYTPTSGMAYCIIEAFGGGGGGGGSGYSTSNMNSGGGGSGGAGRLVASAATIGASQSVTVGTGGSGGTGGNGGTLTNPTNGSSGGTSSVGSLISCTGGGGGIGGTSTVSSGGSMGVASGTGVIVTLQEAGEVGFNVSTTIAVGGAGGDTNFASGGQPTVNVTGSTTTGANGSLGGGGGGGASGQIPGGMSANGGNGGAGYIVITEYIG